MISSDDVRRADFEYLTGRPASAEEIVGSGSIRLHYETDGSIRQMACSAVDYHDPDIRAKLDIRYPPEKSPLISVLVDIAMSTARDDPDGSKLAASKALRAASGDAAKRHWPTGRYLHGLDQRVSGGRHGALFGLHTATVEVKQQLGLSGDPSKSLLWLAPVERRHPLAVVDLLGTRRKPMSAVASELAILTREELGLTIRRRGRRATMRKADVERLETWIVANLSFTMASLCDAAVPFDAWVEEVTRELHAPLAGGGWWSSAFYDHLAARAGA